MTLERGSLLNNRYRILEILGQGGMGSIYRAVDENLGVEVAVKENLFTTEEYARQFRREAIILANLRHPNLPRVTDHFVIEPQGQYLIMDFIEGEDLRERMDRDGILSDTDVVILGSALCDALSYLHSRQPQIIHRDIKPGNVKINPNGQILLVDFGLAKVVESGQATTTGARAMTPGYSPPEQYGTARTDERSDIYSLGATLYVALTNELPEDALARAMGQTDLTPVRRYNPKVSRKLAGAIEKALELRAEDRFHSAEEFKQALLNARLVTGKIPTGENVLTPPPAEAVERLSGSNGDSARVQSSSQAAPVDDLARAGGQSLLPTSRPILEPVSDLAMLKPAKKARRQRSCSVYLLFLGGLLGLMIAGVFIFQPFRWNEAIGSAEQLLSSWSLPTNLAFLIPVANSTPTITQSVSPTAQSQANQVTLTTGLVNVIPSSTVSLPPTAIPTLRPINTPTPADTPTPTKTPDGGGGGLIAFASDATNSLPQIWLMNVDGTAGRQITDMAEGACQPAWAPDGKRLVFISPCGGNQEMYPGASLFIVNLDGTDLIPLPTQPGGDFDPAWSPDGGTIIFTTLREANLPQIYAINLSDNTVHSISNKNKVRDLQPGWSPDGKQIVFITTRNGPSQVWIMERDGSNPVLFSRSASLKNSHPVWSPDGQTIMFTQNKELGGVPRLVAVQLERPTFPRYVATDGTPMKESAYSPDGIWIAFESYPQGFDSHDIYIMTSNGVGRMRLTYSPGFDFDAAWQPVVSP
jgi:serine/threonine protein kinase